MVKKTAKPTKSNLQRTREEQWRRRLAAQGGAPATGGAAGATMAPQDEAELPDASQATYVPRDAVAPGRSTSTSTARSGAATRSRMVSPMTNPTQRRMAQPARSGRLRMAANAMSVDEEMHYVRSDIRRLILLTAICLAVLIALSFVIR